MFAAELTLINMDSGIYLFICYVLTIVSKTDGAFASGLRCPVLDTAITT